MNFDQSMMVHAPLVGQNLVIPFLKLPTEFHFSHISKLLEHPQNHVTELLEASNFVNTSLKIDVTTASASTNSVQRVL